MRNLFIDFLNYIFFLILVSFFIIYFIAGDRFEAFTAFLKALAPIGLFGLLFVVKIFFTRREIKKKEDDGDTDIIIYLTTKDKFINDIIIFLIPIIILSIAFFGDKINKVDIFQALIAFLIVFAWSSYIFKKR